MTEINLLNPKTNSKRPGNGRVAVLCGLVFFAITFVALLCWYLLLQSEIERRTALESRLREESLELDRIGTLIAQNHEEQVELDIRAASLEKLRQNRQTPIKVLDAVTGSLPFEHKLSLTRLSQAEQRVHLSGKSLDLTAMTDYVLSLETSALFESVEINRWETHQNAFQFEILCVLKE
jgi:Tfp pilus assembly protein PilN